jgi:hypothetical protein
VKTVHRNEGPLAERKQGDDMKIRGIKAWSTGDISAELKRAALLCDELVIKHVHSEAYCDDFPDVKANIEYLMEKGIAVAAPSVSYDVGAHPWLADYDRAILEDPSRLVRRYAADHLFDPPHLYHAEEYKQQVYRSAGDAYARVAASILTEPDVADAVPFLALPFATFAGIPTRRASVIRAIYDGIPFPGADTSWEAILDWRDDPAAVSAFKKLRAWVSKSSHSESSIAELAEELEVAMDEYSRYMKARHAKIASGRFEAICIGAAKVLEELPRIKLSPLLEAVFRPEALEAELTLQELSAPGREAAYLVRTREKFS